MKARVGSTPALRVMIVKCLGEGYVRLVDYMGSDLKTVNSARASFMKAVDKIGPADIKLINYLGEHDHTSPFRNNVMTFEIKMPLMIFMQLQKYFVGSNHTFDNLNAASRRYVSLHEQFHVPGPNEWRSAPENRKQGSGPLLTGNIPEVMTKELQEHVEKSRKLYELAIASGVCVEQARMFLPAYSLYTVAYWTTSLQTLTHVLNQRVKTDAQREWDDYTRAFYSLTNHLWPLSMRALLEPEIHQILTTSSITSETI